MIVWGFIVIHQGFYKKNALENSKLSTHLFTTKFADKIPSLTDFSEVEKSLLFLFQPDVSDLIVVTLTLFIFMVYFTD